MRKRDPNKVIDEYQDLLRTSITVWGEIGFRIGWEADYPKALSVDAFLRAAVGWESFRSDWHMAVINQDSSAYREALLARFKVSVEERWPGLTGRVAVELPKHPSLGLLADLLDSRGFNVTFPDCDRWVDRSKLEFVSPWRERIGSLPKADRSLLDAVTALRDCIAHQSRGSTDRLDRALKKLNVAPDKRLRRGKNRVQPAGVGTYLYAVGGPAGARRVQVFHSRLDAIAESLRV